MSSLQDLLARKQALDAKIAEMQQSAKRDAIAQVKELMEEYGLTAEDLGSRAVQPRKASKPVAAKYRNKATGETWSGRGLQPKWLKAAIAAGAKLDDFAV